MDEDAAHGDIAWRPVTEKDIPAWVELLAAAEGVDHTDEHFNEQDLAEELAAPLFERLRGTLAGFDGETLAALGIVRVRNGADPVHRVTLDGTVHPAHRGRGLGTRLLEWGPTAARQLHEERFPGRPLELNVGCISTNTGAIALFERHGYKPSRYYADMRRRLDGELPPIDAVEGFEFIAHRPEVDAEALAVKNEAFKDHWGTSPSSAEQWRSAFAGSASFRPDLSFLAVHADTRAVAGLIMAKHYEADSAATGVRDVYIDIVGTLREARGRGVASRLLAETMHAARAAGFDTVSLGVDTQNPTGAVGVYERAGLSVKYTWVNYSRAL